MTDSMNTKQQSTNLKPFELCLKEFGTGNIAIVATTDNSLLQVPVKGLVEAATALTASLVTAGVKAVPIIDALIAGYEFVPPPHHMEQMVYSYIHNRIAGRCDKINEMPLLPKSRIIVTAMYLKLEEALKKAIAVFNASAGKSNDALYNKIYATVEEPIYALIAHSQRGALYLFSSDERATLQEEVNSVISTFEESGQEIEVFGMTELPKANAFSSWTGIAETLDSSRYFKELDEFRDSFAGKLAIKRYKRVLELEKLGGNISNLQPANDQPC